MIHTFKNRHTTKVRSCIMVLLTAMMLWGGLTASAADTQISAIYNHGVILGAPSPDIDIYLFSSEEFMGVEFTLTMPEGLALYGEGIRKGDLLGPGFSLRKNEAAPGRWRVLCMSSDNSTFTGANELKALFKLNVICDETFNDKDIIISDIIFSKRHNDFKVDDSSISIRKYPLTLSLNRTSLSMDVGETVLLTATAESEILEIPQLKWTSSDTGIATVDEDGNVTAIAAGSADIQVACGSITATCRVTVNGINPTNVIVTPATAELEVGNSLQLTAKVMPENASVKTVTWTSTNTDVVTVDETGRITAVSPGVASVKAQCGYAKGSCQVTVTAPGIAAQQVIITPASTQISVGKSMQLSAAVLPAETTDKTVTWTSSDPTIVTVDATGTITAVSEGQATVSARCGEASGQCAVTVTAPYIEATQVTVLPMSQNLTVGHTLQLTAEVLPENTTDKTVTWESSDTQLATVDENGLVTGHNPGNVTIIATCGQAHGSTTVIVVPEVAEPTELRFLEQEVTIAVGSNAVSVPYSVSPQDMADLLQLTVSDPTVVTASKGTKTETAHTLLLTPLAAGTANVTLSYGSKSATLAVTVVQPVQSIVFPYESIEIPAGETRQLNIAVYPDNATDKSITVESLNPSIATINDDYMLTAIAPGTATIKATALDGSGVTSQLTVIVTETSQEIKAEAITIAPTRLTLKPGETSTLKVTISPADATDKTVVWSSDNTSVVTVDNDGRVTAIATGSASVSATTTDGSDLTAECVVEVKEDSSESTTATFNFNNPSSLNPVPEVSTDKSTHSLAGQTFTSANIGIVANVSGQETTPRLWSCSTSGHGIEYRVYNGSTITVKALDSNTLITKIEFTGALLNTILPNANGSTTAYTWTDANGQESIEFAIKTNGKNKRADISTVTVTYKTISGIEDVTSGDNDATVEYYNLNGIRIQGEPAPGLYIRRQGTEVTKVVIR